MTDRLFRSSYVALPVPRAVSATAERAAPMTLPKLRISHSREAQMQCDGGRLTTRRRTEHRKRARLKRVLQPQGHSCIIGAQARIVSRFAVRCTKDHHRNWGSMSRRWLRQVTLTTRRRAPEGDARARRSSASRSDRRPASPRSCRPRSRPCRERARASARRLNWSAPCERNTQRAIRWRPGRASARQWLAHKFAPSVVGVQWPQKSRAR